jgi:hypothetical protein
LLNPTPVPCRSYTQGQPAAWPTVDPNTLATLASFDPCAIRHPQRADALRPSGGPYLSRDEIVRRETSSIPGGQQPTKVRAYLTTFAGAIRLTGGDGEDPGVYPDREVWLMVSQGPGCAVPSGKPGGPPPERPRYCFGAYDATTGHAYFGGSGPANAQDWPPYLPLD